MADDWDEALKRFQERTLKRRERAKGHEEEAQQIIREAEERQDDKDKPAE
jgi:hypothetical protein